MKLSYKIALSIAFVGVAGIVAYIVSRIETKRKLSQIADEGYETAHDILFPGKVVKAKRLQYGPVIPV
jgi:hypothetical protein